MAAQNDSLTEFFELMKAQEVVIVEEPPRFDLDTYISHYSDRTRFQRLIFIGKSSVPLCVEALKAAVHEAKQGTDIERYKEAWECIRIAAPNEPEAVLDQQWIDRVDLQNTTELQRLEGELKGYRNNLIKESIRMGHEDIGRFYQRTGKTQDAVEAYTRMRHEVSTVRHITESTRLLAEVAVERRTWSEVVSQGNKALGMRDYEEEKTTRPPVQVLVGIGLLGEGKFQEAAETFLGIEPTATYDWIASASDVAIYGGLLALATMDRFTLQKSTLENSRFRSFLEQEPNVRKSISLFINGRYSLCLANLEPIRPDLLLDIHMQKHVETIFRTIRRKCIVQYFMPFSCVTIKTLEREFSSGKPLEQELIEMIRDEELDARIDAKAGLLIAVRANRRQALQKNALDVARRYEKEGKERLRRVNLVTAGLETTGPKKHDTTEDWYDYGEGTSAVAG